MVAKMLMLSKSKLLHPLLQECHCLWQSKYVEPDLDVLLLDVLHLFNIGVNSWLLACHAKLEPHDGGVQSFPQMQIWWSKWPTNCWMSWCGERGTVVSFTKAV